MVRKPSSEQTMPRVSIGLPDSTWQEIEKIANEQVRPKAVQTAYFVKLGLMAHKNGFVISGKKVKQLKNAA